MTVVSPATTAVVPGRTAHSSTRRRAADAAQARDVPQELLVHGPEASRPDHRAVVEADRRERPAEAVDDGEQVVLQRTAHVLPAHVHALAERLDADPHVRHAVDGHHAVRAVARAAKKAARPVVLEAPGE